MLLPDKKPLFLKRRHQDNLYRIVLWIALLLGFMFVLRGISQHTIQPFFLATPTPTRSVNSYSLEGETQFTAGNLQAAIDAYLKAVEVDPANPTLWAELARIQTYSTTLLTTDAEKYQRVQEAMTSINKAIEIAPDDSTAHAIKAFVLDWTANPAYVGNEWETYITKAEQEAVKALQLDNTNTLALAFYAEVLVDAQNLLQAQNYIDQAVERDPSLMDVHRIDAYVLESYGSYTQAIEEYKKAIEIAPNLTFLYLRLGANYRQLAFKAEITAQATRLYESALEYFAKATSINEQLNIKDPIPYLSIAKTYSQMGEFFSAARNVRKALQFNPTSPDIYGQLGIVYFKSRNYEGSIPALECAIRGCNAAQSCEVRNCNSETDPQIEITGMPLTSNTVVYYYTYGSVLAAMNTKSTPYCDRAMQVLEEVRAGFSGDDIIMQIVEAGEEICASYGYTRPQP